MHFPCRGYKIGVDGHQLWTYPATPDTVRELEI